MLVTKNFYVSISKKHTQEEVFGFMFPVELHDYLDADEANVRHYVSAKAWDSALIPVVYRDYYFYWASSVCID